MMTFLSRFGLIQQMKTLDEGLAEAISSIIWVAPRLQADVQELKVICSFMFTANTSDVTSVYLYLAQCPSVGLNQTRIAYSDLLVS